MSLSELDRDLLLLQADYLDDLGERDRARKIRQAAINDTVRLTDEVSVEINGVDVPQNKAAVGRFTDTVKESASALKDTVKDSVSPNAADDKADDKADDASAYFDVIDVSDEHPSGWRREGPSA